MTFRDNSQWSAVCHYLRGARTGRAGSPPNCITGTTRRSLISSNFISFAPAEDDGPVASEICVIVFPFGFARRTVRPFGAPRDYRVLIFFFFFHFVLHKSRSLGTSVRRFRPFVPTKRQRRLSFRFRSRGQNNHRQSVKRVRDTSGTSTHCTRVSDG